jgi:hypothetical protein
MQALKVWARRYPQHMRTTMRAHMCLCRTFGHTVTLIHSVDVMSAHTSTMPTRPSNADRHALACSQQFDVRQCSRWPMYYSQVQPETEVHLFVKDGGPQLLSPIETVLQGNTRLQQSAVGAVPDVPQCVLGNTGCPVKPEAGWAHSVMGPL